MLRPDAGRAGRAQAYRKLSRKYHPDKGGSEADFQALGEAHECLTEPFNRMMYDSWLKGDQAEPFNKEQFNIPWSEGEGLMPKVKNGGIILILLVCFGFMAVYGIFVDWMEYLGTLCGEMKRAVLASFSAEEKAKMVEQMGTEEEITAQITLYALLAAFLVRPSPPFPISGGKLRSCADEVARCLCTGLVGWRLDVVRRGGAGSGGRLRHRRRRLARLAQQLGLGNPRRLRVLLPRLVRYLPLQLGSCRDGRGDSRGCRRGSRGGTR